MARWFQGYTSNPGADRYVYEGDGFSNHLVAEFDSAEEAAAAVKAHNANEDAVREADATLNLTAVDAATLLQTVRALLGVVDCGKRNAPAVIDAARATLASIGRAAA